MPENTTFVLRTKPSFAEIMGGGRGGLGLAATTPQQADPAWASVASAIGQQVIGTITIRTQFSPPIVIDPFAPSPPSPGPNPILSLLRPEVVISSPDGKSLVSFAPYGAPSTNYFPWLIVGGIALIFGAAGIIAIVARRFLK